MDIILFIRAQVIFKDKTRGFEAEGIDYITKPFEIHQVIARVRTHVELHRALKFQDEVKQNTTHEFEAPFQADLP